MESTIPVNLLPGNPHRQVKQSFNMQVSEGETQSLKEQRPPS